MNRRLSISSTLVFVITIVFVFSILIAISFSYYLTEQYVHNSFNREKIGAEDLFNKSSMYIHGGLKLWASAYNSDLYQNMEIFLDAYNQSNGHPELLNLPAIISQFDPDIRNNVDLYLINKSGSIEYTTYTSEYGIIFHI